MFRGMSPIFNSNVVRYGDTLYEPGRLALLGGTGVPTMVSGGVLINTNRCTTNLLSLLMDSRLRIGRSSSGSSN